MIKNILRESLLTEEEKKTRKNKYGCLMVYTNIKDGKWGELLKEIEEGDLYNDPDDPSYGFENNPHTTILYGLHEEIKDEDIEKDIKEIKEPIMKISDISLFENDKYDVLKFDVESEDLNKLNNKFKQYPHTNDYPQYHAHMTICYLKKGKGEKYIEKLQSYKKIEFEPTKIVYSKTNGDKKTYKFKK